MEDSTKDLKHAIIWSKDHMETKRLANILGNRALRLEAEVAHLRAVIDEYDSMTKRVDT